MDLSRIAFGEVGLRFKQAFALIKGRWWMPWVEEAMKDVVWLRKASGSRLTSFDPEMSE